MGASIWGPQKPIGHAHHGADRLKKTLSWPHLVALGVGAIVGTGIYTLTGVGAERAGPAVILAFAIAGSLGIVAMVPLLLVVDRRLAARGAR